MKGSGYSKILKYSGDSGAIIFILIILFFFIIGLLLPSNIGDVFFLYSIAIAMAIGFWGIVCLFYRTHNIPLLVGGIFAVCWFVGMFVYPFMEKFWIIILILYLPPFKRKYSHIQLMELAARSVIKATDGFTNRPFPGGKFDYTNEELMEFAKFFSKQMAAPLYKNEACIILIFSGVWRTFIPFKTPNLQKVTYIAFDYSGKVTFHMDNWWYKQYKHELAYDEICRSFVQVVMEFFNMYKEGKRKEILTSLKDAEFPEGPSLLPVEFLEIKGNKANE